MFGEGSKETYALDLASGIWQKSAGRPVVGHHIASEVIDGKWYLFGGLNAPSGNVQIYDPVADTWVLGADIPVDSGSASTALIDGKVYYAGGILPADTTTDQAAVYDPVLDQWSSIAPMPFGRNHAASGTDGVLFYVFGGRGPGSGDDNSVAAGFDTVQVYDPATDSWETSEDTGSSWPALPQKRGGMGKAVMFRGEFYVIGGETTDSSVPDGVYDRVDVFNPITRTWRLEAPMPTARHGIFPVLIDRKLWVTGGGVKSAHSSSTVVERFHR